MFENKKIMIVVAHPDDEILGLGATMNLLINERGIKTHLVILGEGITSRSDQRDVAKWNRELKIHKSNIEKARLSIGYHGLSVYDLPDNRFDTIPLLDIIKIVEKEKESFLPDMIFTHHGGDLNIDHQKTFQAVMTACRPMPGENVKAIITFETASGTEWRASADPYHFISNFFVSVKESNIDAKIKAMEAYEFEKRSYPHPRSGEALRIQAKRLGITIGEEYAEAFCLVRGIIGAN
ncbi:PIG-L family deacetylase [Chryseolinea sp. H1M3-3]|uniref:PIG-L deacetylase family protein n=1 Tax=Chryseolinea sp. H1M3-3 TaxID=3034144 RepID=UPI0023EB677B|nr:PIG-L family deacetylase [Chryseolinea sp. H1M3-3]